MIWYNIILCIILNTKLESNISLNIDFSLKHLFTNAKNTYYENVFKKTS